MSATHAESYSQSPVYGMVAEFETPEEILAAAEKVREAGYTNTEGYTPFPIEGLDAALGMSNTRLGWAVLIMGVIGGVAGFFMQWYANVHFYPLNIGGTPLNSWPRYVVITFECVILFSAFTAGLFMLGRNGLPQPYHSIFNTPNFETATRDHFFLCVEARDPKFNASEVRSLLETCKPLRVSEVAV